MVVSVRPCPLALALHNVRAEGSGLTREAGFKGGGALSGITRRGGGSGQAQVRSGQVVPGQH